MNNICRYPDILEILLVKNCLSALDCDTCFYNKFCYNIYFKKYHHMVHNFIPKSTIVQYGPGFYDFYLKIKLPRINKLTI